MSDFGNDLVGNQWFGYGSGNDVRTHLFEYRNCSVKNFIPDKVRIPSFIVVIAAFVTILQMCMVLMYRRCTRVLGLFIPLIVVNCIVLGRAEAFAAKNNAFDSMLDGLGIGLGFTIALTLLGSVRELLGYG